MLYSRLAGTPLGDIDVFCTHLTPNFDEDVIPYTGQLGSWEGEQAAQIEQLLQYIDDKAATGRVVVLGDFNTGPSVGDAVSAELPENYDTLVSTGLINTYLEQGNVECTFCDDNPLVGEEGPGGVIIDHVLAQGLSGDTVERILRGSLEIEVDGETVTTAYSDHYGVRALVQ